MNRIWMVLALGATAWFTQISAAAPAPPPPSEGPISDALALRGLLPATPAPTANVAVTAEKGIVELESLVAIPVAREEVETIKLPHGMTEQVKRVVTSTVYETRAVRVKVDTLKFFTVNKEGKLDSLDGAKAAAMLKQRTPVLTGDSADVDPRNLELVRPGTLYLVLPPPEDDPRFINPPPLPPGAGKP